MPVALPQAYTAANIERTNVHITPLPSVCSQRFHAAMPAGQQSTRSWLRPFQHSMVLPARRWSTAIACTAGSASTPPQGCGSEPSLANKTGSSSSATPNPVHAHSTIRPASTSKAKRAALGSAAALGGAVLVSRAVGMLREVTMASAFGVSAVADAFGYASQLPNFFMGAISSLNGPIHSALMVLLTAPVAAASSNTASSSITTTTTTNNGKEDQHTAETAHSASASLTAAAPVALQVFIAVLLAGAICSGLLWLGSHAILAMLAPALASSAPLTLQAADHMLQMLAPAGVLSGIAGIATAILAAQERYLLAALSPALVSMCQMASVQLRPFLMQHGLVVGAGVLADSSVVALGTLVGYVLQCSVLCAAAITTPACNTILQPARAINSSATTMQPGTHRASSPHHQQKQSLQHLLPLLLPGKEAQQVLQLVGSTTLSTMLFFMAAWVDLTLASSVQGAAAAWSYGALLAFTPAIIVGTAMTTPLATKLAKALTLQHGPQTSRGVKHADSSSGHDTCNSGSRQLAAARVASSSRSQVHVQVLQASVSMAAPVSSSSLATNTAHQSRLDNPRQLPDTPMVQGEPGLEPGSASTSSATDLMQQSGSIQAHGAPHLRMEADASGALLSVATATCIIEPALLSMDSPDDPGVSSGEEALESTSASTVMASTSNASTSDGACMKHVSVVEGSNGQSLQGDDVSNQSLLSSALGPGPPCTSNAPVITRLGAESSGRGASVDVSEPSSSANACASSVGGGAHSVGSAMLLTAVTALPVSALVASLSTPLTQLLFMGREQSSAAGALALVAAMAHGMAFATFPFTMRDVLMRAIIALKDVHTPFQVSMLGLVTKVLFGWLVVVQLRLGPAAIPLGSVVSNVASLLLVTWKLSLHVPGLLVSERIQKGGEHAVRLALAAGACGWSSQAAFTSIGAHWPSGMATMGLREAPLPLSITVSAGAGLLAYFALLRTTGLDFASLGS